MKKDAYKDIFSNKERVMVIMPHPDDTELYCGGTIARLLDNNIDVVTVKLTNGGKATKQSNLTENELNKKRKTEDNNAAKALGIPPEKNIQLDVPDGEIENNLETIEKLARLFRIYRPDLLITCNPEHVVIRFAKDVNWINHRDHRSTGQVAIDAAYPYSRDFAFFPHQIENIEEEYKPTTEFLLSDYYEHPDMVYVDITKFVRKKIDAWQKHESAYSADAVEGAVEFLNKDEESSNYYEAFRYVIAD